MILTLDQPDRIVGWRAWYTDGSVYDSREIDWPDLPADGVLAVKVFYDTFARGRRHAFSMTNGDWYWRWGRTGTTLANGEWVEPPDLPERELKRGRWTASSRFQRLLLEVAASERS